MGSCLIIPSAFGNTVVASVRTELTKPQRIRPTDKKGRNSRIGALKIFPKIMPMHAIVTPMDIVIQKGPRFDLLYLCLMSEYAKKTGKRLSLKDMIISFSPAPKIDKRIADELFS